ncbi:autotransporter outer membrane beta-barrel domain-containing protein [Methylocapsa acidiphila]|uniref:autotransporter outer membrane beta-barrel domain-containing protein n=1 Tax=Methylocapsa acidiphila TaxID=133552 RepID=UPI0004251D5E|nr:autotransporter outer membrane beta-barrel domain-containing protein [Methylocapsa acidiphila]
MRIFGIIQRASVIFSAVIVLAAASVDRATAQSADGLPLPPGKIIVGSVYRGTAFNGYVCPDPTPCPGTSVPSIATGVDANAYLLPKYTDPSFTPSGPAVVVLTAAPTQYVRFYNPAAGSNQIGGYIVGSNEVRGLTPEQIQNVLALSFTPTLETIVQVPAGTCLLVGPTNALYGQQGGAVQEFLVGKSQGGAGCGPVPQFIPSSGFINGQPIGAFALAYAPRAGGGNAGAVAKALDHATPPPLFSDMDSIYNALDVLNFGSSGALPKALAQLDGEIYADAPSVAAGVGQMFLDALRDQTHLARSVASSPASAWRPWASGLGGGGALFGNGDTHGLRFGGGGIAAGGDYRFSPALQAGLAAAYMRSAFNTSGISGRGVLDSVAVGSYVGYAIGPWYADGALGYSYNSAGVNRNIDFPGVARAVSGYVAENASLSRAEVGYRLQLDDRATATPFTSFQGIVVRQNSFGEGGGGAIDLNVKSRTAALALSTLGVELAYDLSLGLAAPLDFSARAGWAHDFADVNRSVTASLEGTPDASFSVNGARWPRNAAAIGARFSLPTPAANLFVRYDGALASNASIHSATVGALITF